jgi:hypothetical protein
MRARVRPRPSDRPTFVTVTYIFTTAVESDPEAPAAVEVREGVAAVRDAVGSDYPIFEGTLAHSGEPVFVATRHIVFWTP